MHCSYCPDTNDRPTDEPTAAAPVSRREALAGALRNASYEILPFKSTEANVLAHVPLDVALTVTTTEVKGLGPTLDLAVRLTLAYGGDLLALQYPRDLDPVGGIGAVLRF